MFISDTNPVARKEHQCYFCRLTIEKGERYNRSFFADYGDVCVQKSHRFCDRMAQKFYRENDYAPDEGMDHKGFAEHMECWYKKKIKSLEEACPIC